MQTPIYDQQGLFVIIFKTSFLKTKDDNLDFQSQLRFEKTIWTNFYSYFSSFLDRLLSVISQEEGKREDGGSSSRGGSWIISLSGHVMALTPEKSTLPDAVLKRERCNDDIGEEKFAMIMRMQSKNDGDDDEDDADSALYDYNDE